MKISGMRAAANTLLTIAECKLELAGNRTTTAISVMCGVRFEILANRLAEGAAGRCDDGGSQT